MGWKLQLYEERKGYGGPEFAQGSPNYKIIKDVIFKEVVDL